MRTKKFIAILLGITFGVTLSWACASSESDPSNNDDFAPEGLDASKDQGKSEDASDANAAVADAHDARIDDVTDANDANDAAPDGARPIQIAAGYAHTCLIRASGSVLC